MQRKMKSLINTLSMEDAKVSQTSDTRSKIVRELTFSQTILVILCRKYLRNTYFAKYWISWNHAKTVV